MTVASVSMILFKPDYRRKAAELRHSLIVAARVTAAVPPATQHIEVPVLTSGLRDDAAETTKLLLSSS